MVAAFANSTALAGKPAGTARHPKYLTIYLDAERFGLDVRFVQQIIPLPPITIVATSSEPIAGVVNLRGRVIPVIDLRQRLNMSTYERTRDTCIVVVEGIHDRTTGLIVDRVSDVTAVPPDIVEPFSPANLDIDPRYVSGLAQIEKGVLVLLHLENVLAPSSAPPPPPS
ncbi:MAG: purine-binding chemotaxis protein CheW [Myxococcales bacterium FL481]|nr:MAG: purine-binding chemotaxis protein CheW [Myxococcales bacterium FL481]